MHYLWSELLCSVRMRIASFTIDALHHHHAMPLPYGLYIGSKSLGSEASMMVMHYLRSDSMDGIFCMVFRSFTDRKGKEIERAPSTSFSTLFAQVLNEAAIAHKLLCLHILSGRTKGVFGLPFLTNASIMCLSALLWTVESPKRDFLAGGFVRTPYDNQC